METDYIPKWKDKSSYEKVLSVIDIVCWIVIFGKCILNCFSVSNKYIDCTFYFFFGVMMIVHALKNK